MKAFCVLMLLFCACRAFGEGPAYDSEANGENMFKPEENVQENNLEANNYNQEDNEQDDDDNVSKESFIQAMSKYYDETPNAQGNKPSNKTVCYLRVCTWVSKQVKIYYPVYSGHNYTHHYPVTVKVPHQTTYICGQIGYTISRPYQVKVPQRQKTCHVYGGHKYCSHKTLYMWVTKYRTFTLYKPKTCIKTIYKIGITYKTQTVPGSKAVYKHRLETVRRYICTYNMGGYYNPSNW